MKKQICIWKFSNINKVKKQFFNTRHLKGNGFPSYSFHDIMDISILKKELLFWRKNSFIFKKNAFSSYINCIYTRNKLCIFKPLDWVLGQAFRPHRKTKTPPINPEHNNFTVKFFYSIRNLFGLLTVSNSPYTLQK